MGKVLSAPAEVGDTPRLDLASDAYLKAENEYIDKVIAWAKMNGRGDCTGEEIMFPVADGFARYIVLSIRPVQLIHLAVGDAWQFQYVERLTAKDVKSQVAHTRMRNRLFSAVRDTGGHELFARHA
jgi:hypothetical protein